MRDMTKQFALCAALSALILSACESPEAAGGGESVTATEEGGDAEQSGSGEEIVFSETGWLTVGADGAVQTTFIDPDGRYRDLRNGEQVAAGMWEQRRDGALCFEPDQGVGACWEPGNLEDDGSVIVTNGDGKNVEIKEVTYIPPADDDSEEEAGG